MPTVVHSQMCIFSWGLAPKSGLKSRGDLRVWTYRHYKRWTDGHRYHDITHWFAEVSHGKPQFQCFHYFIGGVRIRIRSGYGYEDAASLAEDLSTNPYPFRIQHVLTPIA